MDAAAGKVTPAFDEAKLGAALRKVSDKTLNAKEWPRHFDFQRLPDGKLLVSLGFKQYHCDL